ncbi:hypothetical protein F4778DRAFT_778000 [Xylariomycetidae sp. FL2044]|nr:hypothetical protein F4778DRAFT_778000 [Xylariomycetidae sp. FL2044]
MPSESFHLYQRLPPELKIYVWQHALENESKHRVVFLLCGYEASRCFIVPSTHLCSPLFRVNHLSRHIAKGFFSTTVDVFNAVEWSPAEAAVYSPIPPHFRDFLDRARDKSSRAEPTPDESFVGRRAGVVRLNLRTDRVLLFPMCMAASSMARILKPRLGDTPTKLRFNFRTRLLPLADREKINTLSAIGSWLKQTEIMEKLPRTKLLPQVMVPDPYMPEFVRDALGSLCGRHFSERWEEYFNGTSLEPPVEMPKTPSCLGASCDCDQE